MFVMTAPTQKLPAVISVDTRVEELTKRALYCQGLATAAFKRGDVPAAEFYSSGAWAIQRRINIIKKEKTA